MALGIFLSMPADGELTESFPQVTGFDLHTNNAGLRDVQHSLPSNRLSIGREL